MALVNAGTHVSSMCWAKSFLIACIDSREMWLLGCANGMFVYCGLFKCVARILEVSWSA